MSKIKLLIFVSLIATLVAYAPVAAFTPAPPRALPGQSKALAGCRIISALTVTGLSARSRGVPSLWSMLWTEAPGIAPPYSHHRRCVYYADDTG